MTTSFVYRDRLWQGADLAGLGVASFGHINGVHLQNADQWDTWKARRSSATSCRSDAPTVRQTRSG